MRAESKTSAMNSVDHIALVTPRIESALACLPHLADRVGPIEEFPSEGTREVYVGSGPAKLLLMQPLGAEGPYARALARRGPGLHHVALHVPDLGEFVSEISGWLLHPASVATIARGKTAWLARPGVPTLLEVHEAEPAEGEPLITSVEVPADLDGMNPMAGLSRSPDAEVWVTVDGKRLSARSLAAGS